MNFRRIEWIFFLAFIVLDIFLIFTYFQQNWSVVSIKNSNQGVNETIMKSIRNDQIEINPILSNRASEGYYLASPNSDDLKNKADTDLRYVTWTYNDHKLTGNFTTLIKINDSDNPQKTLNSVVDDASLIIHGKDYAYSKELSSKNTIVYTQIVHGKPIYTPEGQLRFTVKGGYVVGYTQRHLAKIHQLREVKKTISQRRAVILLYQYNKIPANSTVKWVKLGYTKLLIANNNTILIPTWNVKIKSDTSGIVQYRRLNAFTGAIMDD